MTINDLLLSSAAPLSARSPEKPARHFNQVELARRWNISPRTLERWRWLKQPPGYIKIGGRVVYTIEDVEAFEKAQRRQPSSNGSKAA